MTAPSRWTPERVLAAAAAWVWIPEGAIEVHADDYLLIRYPDRILDPGFPAAQVVWLKSTRPFAEVIDEVAAQVRAWGLDQVDWWTSAATIPAEAESDLQGRGAELAETRREQARRHARSARRSSSLARGQVPGHRHRRHRAAIARRAPGAATSSQARAPRSTRRRPGPRGGQ